MRRLRGNNAIEFALTLPVFVAIFAAIVEFAWVYYNRAAITTAVHEGCRDGAVVSPELGDPVAEARTGIQDMLIRAGYDCGPTFGDCLLELDLEGVSPDETLFCSADVAYLPMMGLIPYPRSIRVESTYRLEMQR